MEQIANYLTDVEQRQMCSGTDDSVISRLLQVVFRSIMKVEKSNFLIVWLFSHFNVLIMNKIGQGKAALARSGMKWR